MNAKEGGFERANTAATSHQNARAAGFVSNGERSVAKRMREGGGVRTGRQDSVVLLAVLVQRSFVRAADRNRLHFFNDENRSNFRKSRRQLASNMRKIGSTARTSPSSGFASLASTTGKTPWRTRGRVMFFLLRTAFWLSIVIVLLPAPESMKTESGVGAAQAVGAASATFSDMSQFCTRQPDACQIGSQAFTQFSHKAQASAKWLYDMLTSKAGSAQTPAEPAKAVAETDSQNTLTQADAALPWRGSGQRQADLKRPQ